MPVNELDETRALVGLEEARLFVLRRSADRTRDELLIDAINDVSGAIWDYCQREFKPTAINAARIFNYDGQGKLDLAPYDLRALTSVKLYTDLASAQQVTLTGSQYRLEPRGGSRAGTYLAVALPYPSYVETTYGFGWQVTVTGDWGMAETPYAVKLACKQWVDNLVKNPGSWASSEYNGYSVQPEFDEPGRRAGMPPAVRHRLEPWRRNRRSALRSVRLANDASVAPTVPHTLPTV